MVLDKPVSLAHLQLPRDQITWWGCLRMLPAIPPSLYAPACWPGTQGSKLMDAIRSLGEQLWRHHWRPAVTGWGQAGGQAQSRRSVPSCRIQTVLGHSEWLRQGADLLSHSTFASYSSG